MPLLRKLTQTSTGTPFTVAFVPIALTAIRDRFLKVGCKALNIAGTAAIAKTPARMGIVALICKYGKLLWDQ
jgi:hypothetical protein